MSKDKPIISRNQWRMYLSLSSRERVATFQWRKPAPLVTTLRNAMPTMYILSTLLTSPFSTKYMSLFNRECHRQFKANPNLKKVFGRKWLSNPELKSQSDNTHPSKISLSDNARPCKNSILENVRHCKNSISDKARPCKLHRKLFLRFRNKSGPLMRKCLLSQKLRQKTQRIRTKDCSRRSGCFSVHLVESQGSKHLYNRSQTLGSKSKKLLPLSQKLLSLKQK
jgi:hypothetical protein